MRKLFLSAIVIFSTAAPNLSLAKDIYVSTSFHEPANEGLRFIIQPTTEREQR